MKRLLCSCVVIASLASATVYADDTASPTDDVLSNASTEAEIKDTSDPVLASGWKMGIGVNLGVGPAIDLLDPCYGYSARIGANLHDKYWGIGLEVTWNTVWSTASAGGRNHRHTFADKTSNSGLLLTVSGYLPTSNHFVISLTAGAGLGVRYENFSAAPRKDRTTGTMDPSWLVRVQTGAMWLVTDNFTIGFDMEVNFGNYWSELPRWSSDDKLDISLGAILTFSYQFFFD